MNKNTIYYRFLSEKKKYCINFDTTEISIGDIKREIARRRNMEKAPEKYDLLFYDENNNEIRDESYKVEPLKLLIIKRIPSYKLSTQFVELIHDPRDIALMKGNEYNYTHKTQVAFVNNAEPLEKIASKISFQLLEDKFKCQLCKKKEKEEDGYIYNPVITLCCYDTLCESCANSDIEQCVLCKNAYVGNIPNKPEFELKEKLYKILNKLKEEAIQMELLSYQNSNGNANNSNTRIDSNQNIINANNITNFVNPIANNINQGMINTPKPNISIIPKDHNPMANIQLNPSFPLFEKARFFIIKSSNKENLETSQRCNEWATTLTNQKKLNEAFHSSNVILIFSASRTGCFQGYAIMTTFIGDQVTNNLWQNENNVKLGGSFGVKWLCCCEMPFTRVKHMVNPINGDLITKSRDTQELPKEIGYELCILCYEQEKAESNLKPMKIMSNDVINSINNEIKLSRDKHIQRQNPSNMRVSPIMNPSFYSFMMGPNYMYPYYPIMPQAQGQTPSQSGQMPVMPNMLNVNQAIPLMANSNDKKVRERERSRDESEKSKSSHSSNRKSKN